MKSLKNAEIYGEQSFHHIFRRGRENPSKDQKAPGLIFSSSQCRKGLDL